MTPDLAGAIAGVILDRLAGFIEVSRQKAKLQEDIARAIESSFQYVLDTYSYESLRTHLDDFLQHDDVQRELAKLTLPYGKLETGWFCQRWVGLYGEPLCDLNLVFEGLLREAEARLAAIPELMAVLTLRTSVQIKNDLSAGVRSIRNEIAAFATVSGSASKEDSVELRYDAQVDAYRNLYNNNQPSAAVAQLLKLEEELRNKTISDRLRFRLHTLIGACALAQGNRNEGIRRFEQAYELQREDPKAQANRALAHFLKGELRQAVQMAEKALAKEGTGTNARSVRTWALAALKEHKNLDELVVEEFFSDTSYVRALGMVFLQAKQYDHAEKYLRLCLAQDDRDIWGRLLLVQTLFARAVPDIEIGLSVSPYEQADSVLGEAASLANESVKLAKQGDNATLIHEALIARARVKAAIGDPDGAKEDLGEVLREDPSNDPAIYNLGLVLMDYGDPAGALESFEKIPEEHRLCAAWQAMAECYLIPGRLKEARYALEKAEKAEQFPHDLPLQFQKAHLLIRERKLSEAASICDELRQRESPLSLRLAALIGRLLGDEETELQLLERGYDIASDGEKERLAAELAMVHFEKKQFEEAVTWFGRSGERVRHNLRLLRAYVRSLFLSKLYQQAYQEAEQARQHGIKDATLLDTQAWITEATGDLDQASRLYESLQSMDPNNPLHTINMLRCKCLLGDIEDTRDALHRLDLRNLSDPVALARAAGVLDIVGDHVQAVIAAYRALRLGWRIPEVHLAYVGLFLAHDDEMDNLRPDKIGPDTAVCLRTGGNTRWVKILGTAEPRDQSEVSVNSPLARCLMGHRVGETLLLREEEIEELKYEIVEIQSVLVRALQESLEQFGTLFPGDLGLQRIEVRDGDLSSILMMVARSGRRAQELLRFYDTGYLTLESLANLLGHHRYDVQRSLYAEGEHPLLCSIGFKEMQKEENACAEQATRITVDLSALITLQHLGLLGKLAERFPSVFVPQQLVSELVFEIAKKRNWETRAKHTLGFRDGRWQLMDIPQSVIKEDVKRLDELLSFVRGCCQSAPVPIKHAGVMTDPEGRTQFVGATSLATLLLAQEERTPVYADDLALRRRGKGECGLESFWTVPLLRGLVSKSLVSKEQYQDACIQLILSNYRYVPVDHDVVMRTIKAGDSTASDTRKVFSVLSGPGTEEEAVIPIAAGVLRDVYLDSALLLRRTFILDAILEALISGRMPEKVVSLLTSCLETIMDLASLQLVQMKKDIDYWYRVMAPTLIPRSLGGRRVNRPK